MDWRENILIHFNEPSEPLTLVADPDGLMREEKVYSAIGKRGFEILVYQDPIRFRYQYETSFREPLEDGKKEALVVILEGNKGKLRELPYDLWRAGRHLEFSLANFFPKLNYSVVSLMRSELDTLYPIYQDYFGPVLGEQETIDYLLKHVYNLELATIGTPEKLLSKLIEKHYRMESIPEEFEQLAISQLKAKPAFRSWPLETIIPQRESFFHFLQESWERYVKSRIEGREKDLLPFPELSFYLDNLFLEGYLEPVKIETPSLLPEWMQAGISVDPKALEQAKLKHLMKKLDRELGDVATYKDWQRFATSWGEFKNTSAQQKLSPELEGGFSALAQKVDQKFETWLSGSFGSLASLPYTPKPVMLHQIPSFLAYQQESKGLIKVALVVVDGLAQEQWLSVKRHLQKRTGWLFEEELVFAWVPTLTSISRQALFAGRIPLSFGDSLGTTAKEKQHWQGFWEERLANPPYYATGLGNNLEEDLEKLKAADAQVLGLVINSVDEIMHGMNLGSRGMLQQIKLWLEDGYLLGLLAWLVKNNYTVFLTSDHGNVEAKGIGRISDGILAEVRGHRARIYPDENLLLRSANKDTISWPGSGLPSEQHVILAKGRGAFTSHGEKVVSHGGITIEEVLVPFIRIREE
jgi:hypothetical protein